MVKKKKLKRLKLISRLLFILYMLLVVYFMFFSETMGRTIVNDNYRYNLTLFKEIKRFYYMAGGDKWFQAWVNLAGNVVCFIPFGLFMPFIYDECKKWYMTIIYTFTFSLIIEIVQLYTKVGCFDVDDLLMNTIGGIIGYILYVISRRIYIYWELHHEK